MSIKRRVLALGAFSAALAPILTHAQRVPAGARPPEAVYVAGKPRIVVANDATDCWWSPTGRFALVLMAPDSEGEGTASVARLVSVSAATGRAMTVWRGSSAPMHTVSEAWFAGTSTACISLYPGGGTGDGGDGTAGGITLFVDARSGKVSTKTGAGNSFPSPTQPIFVVTTYPGDGSEDLSVTHPDGSVTQTLHVPKKEGVDLKAAYTLPHGWCADGISVRLLNMSITRDSGGKSRISRTWQTWNTTTGVLSPESSEPPEDSPPVMPPSRPQPVSLTADPVPIACGPVKATIRPVWLVQGSGTTTRRQLLSPDRNWAEISPTSTAVLVLSRGTVSLTPLRRVTGDELNKLRATERSEALNRAKEVGAALNAYSQDYAGYFPPAGDSFASALDAQLKSSSYLTSPGTGLAFIYAPPSTAVQTGPEAASTVLGYLPMDNGRVVVYGDGHAAWVPD